MRRVGVKTTVDTNSSMDQSTEPLNNFQKPPKLLVGSIPTYRSQSKHVMLDFIPFQGSLISRLLLSVSSFPVFLIGPRYIRSHSHRIRHRIHVFCTHVTFTRDCRPRRATTDYRLYNIVKRHETKKSICENLQVYAKTSLVSE